MIFFIIVPPGDLLYQQKSLHSLHGVGRTICLVPETEEWGWNKCRSNQEVIGYKEFDYRSIRDMIYHEFQEEDIHVVLPYDLVLSRRRPTTRRLSPCSKLDILKLAHWIENHTYAHGSISMHPRNKGIW